MQVSRVALQFTLGVRARHEKVSAGIDAKYGESMRGSRKHGGTSATVRRFT